MTLSIPKVCVQNLIRKWLNFSGNPYCTKVIAGFGVLVLVLWNCTNLLLITAQHNNSNEDKEDDAEFKPKLDGSEGSEGREEKDDGEANEDEEGRARKKKLMSCKNFLGFVSLHLSLSLGKQ